jgi:hypothetical protein
MKKYINLLVFILLTISVSFAQTTTTSKVTTRSGNLSLDTFGSTGVVNADSNFRVTRQIAFDSTSDAATGANVTITAPTKKYVRLTSGTLASIDGIPAGSAMQEVTLVNLTGNTIAINNLTGATAADQIYTGTGGNIQVKANAAVHLFYDTATAKWYVTGGVGSGGSGAGGINYMGENYNAEQGGTTGWSCTTGLAISNVASSDMAGARHFRISKSAGTHANAKCEMSFTVDNGYTKGMLRLAALKKTSANYLDRDAVWFIFDGTTERILDNSIMAGDSPYLENFQPTSGVTSYTLGFRNVNPTAHSNTWTFDFDDLKISPPEGSRGLFGSEWKDITALANASYKPTGGGTLAGSYLRYEWRQSGPNIEIKFLWDSSAGGSGTSRVTFPIPNNLLSTYAAPAGVVQTFRVQHIDPSDQDFVTVAARVNSTFNGIQIYRNGDGDYITGADFLTAATEVYADLSFPIAGWQSGMTLSEDGGTKVVQVSATGNAGTAVTANVTNVTFSNESQDTANAWSGTLFTAPLSKKYDFAGSMLASSGSTAEIQTYVDGTAATVVGRFASSFGTFSGSIFLNKGQTLSFRTTAGITLANNANYHHLSINGVDTPQTLAGGANGVYSKGNNGQVDYQLVVFGSSSDCTAACTTGTCTTCRQTGGKITSVTWDSTSCYRLNGIDGTKYSCIGGAISYTPMVHLTNLSTSSYALVCSSASNVNRATVVCTSKE